MHAQLEGRNGRDVPAPVSVSGPYLYVDRAGDTAVGAPPRRPASQPSSSGAGGDINAARGNDTVMLEMPDAAAGDTAVITGALDRPAHAVDTAGVDLASGSDGGWWRRADALSVEGGELRRCGAEDAGVGPSLPRRPPGAA